MRSASCRFPSASRFQNSAVRPLFLFFFIVRLHRFAAQDEFSDTAWPAPFGGFYSRRIFGSRTPSRMSPIRLNSTIMIAVTISQAMITYVSPPFVYQGF